MRYKIICFLILATLLGSFLRFYDLANNPPSLNNDEIAFGYNAYSILKTARDEHGEFMPLAFRSVGDFKGPVLIYALVPSIAFFGLNDFAVRFPTAFLATLSIPFFFLLCGVLTKDNLVSIFGAFLISISAWHIFYSRLASDHMLGTVLLIIGIWLFLRLIERKSIFSLIASSLTLALSFYSYHSNRVFIPLFILLILILNRSKILKMKSRAIAFLVCLTIFISPLIYQILFGEANKRAGMVLLTQDIDYTRYVILDHLNNFLGGENFLLFFFWLKRYLNYLQSDFLFFNGLNMTLPGTLGLGILYLFELPLLILGLVTMIRKNLSYRFLIIGWILLAIFPSSLTNNEQHAGRSLVALPAILIIVSLGAKELYLYFSRLKNAKFRNTIAAGFLIIISITLIHSFLVFKVHLPYQRGEAFMEGTKEAVVYALSNKDKYDEIVFDPVRGIEAPYIVNIPYIYFLFYSKFDPILYHQLSKNFASQGTHFDKFSIRAIDWREDRYKKGVLFIGSPWSLPLKDVKESEVLKKIYLTNGDMALLIVTLRP